jgi:hypothetical protein
LTGEVDWRSQLRPTNNSLSVFSHFNIYPLHLPLFLS